MCIRDRLFSRRTQYWCQERYLPIRHEERPGYCCTWQVGRDRLSHKPHISANYRSRRVSDHHEQCLHDYYRLISRNAFRYQLSSKLLVSGARLYTVWSVITTTDRSFPSWYGKSLCYVKSNYNFTDDDIDYNAIQAKIDAFVAYSMEYLRTSLEK